MKFINILEAKLVHQKGDNVTQFLRTKLGSEVNTSEIIEIAYDLQAGSYINIVNSNLDKARRYAAQLSEILSKHLETGDSLMDVGTGEITSLTLILNEIDIELTDILAFDNKNRKKKFPLKVFVGDIKEIPLHEKCIDVVTSCHALEPNGENLENLLHELFRVTKKKLVLFEPAYELNSDKGKERMDKLGYIKGIEDKVSKLGGNILDVIPIKNIDNPLNPTACYIIEPPSHNLEELELVKLCVPGTNFILETDGQYMFSKDTGLVFPILNKIPVLKTKSAILATSKC